MELNEFVDKTNIIFILNEIQMQIVSEMKDTKTKFQLKQIFNQYWLMTRRLGKLILSGFESMEKSKNKPIGTLENYFNEDVEVLYPQIIELFKKHLNNEK